MLFRSQPGRGLCLRQDRDSGDCGELCNAQRRGDYCLGSGHERVLRWTPRCQERRTAMKISDENMKRCSKPLLYVVKNSLTPVPNAKACIVQAQDLVPEIHQSLLQIGRAHV